MTGNVDTDDSGTNFHMDPGMTAVQILDYSITNHVNFEADIRIPEDPGIVQVETFGCSVNAFGTCFFGLQLEAVMDRCVGLVVLVLVVAPCPSTLGSIVLPLTRLGTASRTESVWTTFRGCWRMCMWTAHVWWMRC